MARYEKLGTKREVALNELEASKTGEMSCLIFGADPEWKSDEENKPSIESHKDFKYIQSTIVELIAYVIGQRLSAEKKGEPEKKPAEISKDFLEEFIGITTVKTEEGDLTNHGKNINTLLMETVIAVRKCMELREPTLANYPIATEPKARKGKKR